MNLAPTSLDISATYE